MENKLTTKELAPYLPYDLIGINEYGKKVKLNIFNSMKGSGIEDKTIDMFIDLGYKPILHPLSDLNEDNASFLSSDAYMLVLEDSLRLNNITYLDFEKLISNHYDVFGLIKRGLAVDVNTIN